MKPLQPKDWDRDKVWNNIERELRKKKRRRGFLLFWLGSGILVAILAVLVGVSIGQFWPDEVENKPTFATEKSATATTFSTTDTTKSNTISNAPPPDIQAPKVLTPSTALRQTTFETLETIPLRGERLPKASTLEIQTNILDEKNQQLTEADTFVQTPEYEMIILPAIERLSGNFLNTPTQQIPLSSSAIAVDTTKSFYLRLQTTFSTGNALHEGPQDWQQAKADSETFEYASTSTIGVDWQFAKKWYAFTGLSYQLIRSRYEYTSSQSTVRQIESDSAIIYQLNGEEFYDAGTLQETRTTRRFIVHNNALHRFSIPLGIGFIHPLERLQLEARLGTRFQFIQRFDGIALEETTNQHLLYNDLINERYYPNSPSLDLTTALLLHYPLRPDSHLFLGVQYEQTGIIRFGTVPYRTDFRLWGAQLGWRFQW